MFEKSVPSFPLLREKTSSSPSMKKVVLVYGLTAAGTLAWLAGIFLAPYLRSQGVRWAGLVYALYSPVCHQLASRSLCAWGYPLGVCARCLGIYLGFGAGVVGYPFVRGFRRVALPGTGLFLLISSPIVVDTAANFLRVWTTSGGIRLATGFLWGTLLPYYLITGFAELRFRRRG
jgi:uncharacterized membrane protein